MYQPQDQDCASLGRDPLEEPGEVSPQFAPIDAVRILLHSVVTERKAGAVYYVVRGGAHATEAAAKSEAARLQAAGFQCVVKQ